MACLPRVKELSVLASISISKSLVSVLGDLSDPGKAARLVILPMLSSSGELASERRDPRPLFSGLFAFPVPGSTRLLRTRKLHSFPHPAANGRGLGSSKAIPESPPTVSPVFPVLRHVEGFALHD
jgi:hypothetical protein